MSHISPAYRRLLWLPCPGVTGRHCADRDTLRTVQVMQLLDRLYTKFDQLVAQYELFKVETIGAYQCCWLSVGP